MRPLLILIIITVAISATTGCRKEAPVEPMPTDSLGRINRWILDSMRRYYYWADEIPGNYDYSQPTELFFKHLLSSHDRFSWISNGESIPAPSNSYFQHGFHYALVEAAGYNGLLGVVTLINKGGAADRGGLERGSCFSRVNGATITSQNKDAVIAQLASGAALQLTTVTNTGSGWQEGAAVSLGRGFAPENPVHYIRTFAAAGITTGYLYYNSFDEAYDGHLLTAIDKLKQAGIQELILDLRYNAGGSVATSAKLAAMLAPTLTANETYAVYQGNRHEGRKVRSLQAVLNTSGNGTGRQYGDLQPRKLPLQRIFILTTKATLSVAEMIINNLKPFIGVVQIGSSTAGKDEASFLIEDFRVPKQVEWKMQPIVYKLFNKRGEGGYAAGLVPQYPVEELTSLPLAAIGEPADPLVRKALQMVYGANIPGDFSALRLGRRPAIPIKAVYHSVIDNSQVSPVIVRP